MNVIPGEFDLIARFLARIEQSTADSILVPPGDDAAVWAAPSGSVTVASVDTLTEGTHWRPDTMDYADVGWRAAATALSDLAAMGADPFALLVAAVIGPGLTLDELDDFASGLSEGCVAHGVCVAGGDIVRGAATSFSITVLGYVATGTGNDPPALLRRSGARPGDVVAVSGTPGAAAAGLALIEAGRADEPAAAVLLEAHRRPRARLTLGRTALDAGVGCAIDVSDGLLQDFGNVARASGVAIELELALLPLHLTAVALLGENEARDLALGGGDDYELALAGPTEMLASIADGKPHVTIIGRVLASSVGQPVGVRVLDEHGVLYDPPSRGWDQFRSAARGSVQQS